MQNVCLSGSKIGTTFDLLHEIKIICIVCSVSWLQGPLHQVPGLEKAHSKGPKLVCEFWCNGIMTYHFGNLLIKPNTNFITDFYFTPKMQKCLGVQNAGNEGAANFLDFGLFE